MSEFTLISRERKTDEAYEASFEEQDFKFDYSERTKTRPVTLQRQVKVSIREGSENYNRIFLLDKFGNRELICRDPEIAVASRELPPPGSPRCVVSSRLRTSPRRGEGRK